MNKYSSIAFWVVVSMLLVLLSGCGGSKEMQKESRIVWPEPPDTARVVYVHTYRGEEDFSGGLGSIVSSLAGKKSIIKLARPFDVCVAEKGSFYVTDAVQGVVLFDPEKREVRVLGEKSEVDLKDPRGIAYGHGKVFIGLAGSGKVAVLDEEGRYVRSIGRNGQFPNPVDVVTDTTNSRVYVVDNRLHQVLVYSETGDSLFTIGGRGSGDGEFNFPQSAAVDTAGNLYVVDSFNFRVEIFDHTGKFLRSFGKQGDAFGTFARPKGIAIDSYQNIYVIDGLHNNYQIFNNSGEMLMFVGRYSPGNDGFENPVSIAIDRNNAIYVTDNLNGRVQQFQLLKMK
jgi:DNA-binding beta-propeller fold protein YncE